MSKMRNVMRFLSETNLITDDVRWKIETVYRQSIVSEVVVIQWCCIRKVNDD